MMERRTTENILKKPNRQFLWGELRKKERKKERTSLQKSKFFPIGMEKDKGL